MAEQQPPDPAPPDPTSVDQASIDELLRESGFPPADAAADPAAEVPTDFQPPAEGVEPVSSDDQTSIDELLRQASFEDPSALIMASEAGVAPDASEFKLPNFQQVMQDAQASSIDLLRDVELNVKIELGRTRMLVEDVLKLVEGSVVELDKLAGDPVDVFVNDRLVARGEVLVLNDNFCVRVNEIVAGVKDEELKAVVGELRGNNFDLSGRRAVARAAWMLVALIGVSVECSRADTPAATTAPSSAGSTDSAQAIPPAPVPGRFEDDPVRRGPAAASPGIRTGTGSDGYELPRVVGALAAVIGLIFLLRWLGKRFFALPTAQRSSRVVQVLSRSVLSPKQQLILVRVGQRVRVAADNGAQLSPLSEISDPDEVATLLGQLRSEKDSGGMTSSRAFNAMFGRKKKAFGTEEADAHDGADDEADPAHETEERAGGNENIVAATRQELNGLMEKVRLVSNQFGGS